MHAQPTIKQTLNAPFSFQIAPRIKVLPNNKGLNSYGGPAAGCSGGYTAGDFVGKCAAAVRARAPAAIQHHFGPCTLLQSTSRGKATVPGCLRSFGSRCLRRTRTFMMHS